MTTFKEKKPLNLTAGEGDDLESLAKEFEAEEMQADDFHADIEPEDLEPDAEPEVDSEQAQQMEAMMNAMIIDGLGDLMKTFLDIKFMREGVPLVTVDERDALGKGLMGPLDYYLPSIMKNKHFKIWFPFVMAYGAVTLPRKKMADMNRQASEAASVRETDNDE